MAKSDSTKYIVYGVIGITVIAIGYFGIIKPITNAFGLTKDQEDRDADNAIDKLSNQQVFSPLLFEKNQSKISISNQKANEITYQIYNAKGYIYDNEPAAVGAIKSALTLVNISYVAFMFNRNYGIDLHDYLNSFLESNNWVTLEKAVAKMNKF